MPAAWSYDRAMDWLNSRTNYEKKWPSYGPATFNLERMRRLCSLLGDPQDRYPTVHITGTKGKGSTAAMVESILRAAGLRTGLYTSPHLVNIEERIRLNGADVPKERLAALLESVFHPVEKIRHVAVPPHPTFFEIFTAAAFLCFAEEKADWGVIEVGLGGRLDSTNIITPAVSLVTRIGLDHMNILGDTVSEIAGEKGGIIKPGVPVVVAPQERDAERVLRGKAGAANAPVWAVGKDVVVSAVASYVGGHLRVAPCFFSPPQEGKTGGHIGPPLQEKQHGYRFTITTPFATHENLEIPLVGLHQVENAAVAVGAIDALRADGKLAVDEAAVRTGLAEVSVPARVEVMGRAPLVVLDGAHNPISMEALVRALGENFAPRRIVLLYAQADDKDIASSLGALLPVVDEAFFTLTNSPRAAKPEALASIARGLGCPKVRTEPGTAQAFRLALAATAPDEMLLITGSLYLAGDLRPLILETLTTRK